MLEILLIGPIMKRRSRAETFPSHLPSWANDLIHPGVER
jgi:hypothetical protein